MYLPGSYANGFAPRDGEARYQDLWRGCVGAWAPCLGPTGDTLRDWSGQGNHGTIVNATLASAWVIEGGHALSFTATSDHATLGSSVILGSESLTLSAWVKVRSFDNNRYILADFNSAGVLSNGSLRIVFSAGNRFSWYSSDPLVQVFGSVGKVTGEWYHVAGVRDNIAKTVKLYVDGTQEGLTTTYSGTPTGLQRDKLLGRSGPEFGSEFNGHIDDVRMYNRALTSHEVALLSLRPGIAYEMSPRRLRPWYRAIPSYRYAPFQSSMFGAVNA